MRATIAGLTVGFVLAAASASSLADGTARPDALLMVDQHRDAIVERVVKAWPEALTTEQASVLRGTLAGLRADRLLAISISPGLGSLLGVLSGVDKAEAAKGSLAASKALGDAAADLVYTPVTPCRLFDTRSSQGGLGTPTPGVRRTYGATTPVANQGNVAGCAAPSGTAVALIQIGTLTPSGNGLLQGGAQGAASFPNALILYQSGDQYGTAVAMPLNPANGQFDLVEQYATADLYGDLLGYFKPPGDATSLDIKIAGQRVMRYERNVDSPNLIGGHANNSASATGRGQTVSGGGLGATNCPDPWTGSLTRACANTTSADYASVGGGIGNVASGRAATVGGGQYNTADYYRGTTVGGGESNVAAFTHSTVAGGLQNMALDEAATVGGGELNRAWWRWSTVAGGRLNWASED